MASARRLLRESTSDRREDLKRREQSLAMGMDEKDVAGFIAALTSDAEAVEVRSLWRPQLANSRGETVLDAALRS